MTDILIKSPRAIVPVTGSMDEPIILKNQSILISEDKISEIGENISIPQGCEIIDAKRKVVVPGLINSHTHLAMNLLKGYADDMKLHEWLTKEVWPFEAKMTAEDIEFGAKLGAFESISSGATCVNSMYHNGDREIKAISELGLRGVIGHNCFSWRREEDYKATKNLIEKYHRSQDDLIRCNITPHSGYTVDYDFLKQLIELRDHYREKYTLEYAPFIHTHVSETKQETQLIRNFLKEQGNVKIAESVGSPVQYLHETGILDEACIAHAVWLSEVDIQFLKRDDARVASCPVSNLKLSSGIALLKKIVDGGVTVGLGTDSSSSNNTLDMFETIRAGSLLQKVHKEPDPQAIPAYQAIWFGTRGSARAIHWDKEIGSIEVGKKADITIVDFRAPHLIPVWHCISHLAFAVKGSDVSDVIINGELLYKDKKFKKIDFMKFHDEAEIYFEKLQARLNT